MCVYVFATAIAGMLINNSVEGPRRGAVNGAAETVGGLGRLIAPPLSSPLFAWSLQQVPVGHGDDMASDAVRAEGVAEAMCGRDWPFNHHLLFWCNGGLAMVALCLAVVMPESISRPPAHDRAGPTKP